MLLCNGPFPLSRSCPGYNQTGQYGTYISATCPLRLTPRLNPFLLFLLSSAARAIARSAKRQLPCLLCSKKEPSHSLTLGRNGFSRGAKRPDGQSGGQSNTSRYNKIGPVLSCCNVAAPDTEPRLHHTAELWAGVATSHHEPVADRLCRQNRFTLAAFAKRGVDHRDRPDGRAGQGSGKPAAPCPHAARLVL